MKVLIAFIIISFFFGCERNQISADKLVMDFEKSYNFHKNGESFEIKVLDINDRRCEINPAFSAHSTLPAEVTLELVEKNCTGIECSKKITLLNYECGENGKTNIKEIFNEKSKTIDGYSTDAMGLEVGLLQVDPNPIFDLVKREYLKTDKIQYKATIIVK